VLLIFLKGALSAPFKKINNIFETLPIARKRSESLEYESAIATACR
jgi:hypothetical protein